ncbi:MAG: glycosyltransferase family 4 protein [Ferruginibacter sp.]
MKKTIIHFAYQLGHGGAETMLVSLVKELTEYRNIVVIMGSDTGLKDELKCDRFIQMNLNNMASFLRAIPKLRAITKEYKADLVHTHLFWPTIIARIATPKKVHLVTTIHTSVASASEYKSWYIRQLDVLTYNLRKSVIIAVSKGALNEYFNFLKLKPSKSYVLNTFVDTSRFKPLVRDENNSTDEFKIVSVGALRQSKNFEFLVKAFSKINDNRFLLHIYGRGDQQAQLQNMINSSGANVKLMGEVTNIQAILSNYDLFTLSSRYEGFSLSVLEAMAMQVPLLLSDISSFREQCEDSTIYFDLDNTSDFINKLKEIQINPAAVKIRKENAYQRIMKNFTLEHHLVKLRSIYQEIFSL